MDDKKYEFLPDDFEFIGDKQNINIDEVAPARPAWKDVVYRFTQNKGAILYYYHCFTCYLCTNDFSLEI